MAVYDGFFDAVADEETGEFDRAYGSGNFTDYFAHIVGSGVCIHNAPDSFRVRFEDGNAVISPGYLFIQGYWLKNDSDYTISVTGTSTLAIVAHLNLGKRMIELEARSMAQAYPDSLVLALVNPAAGTAEDTRHNTDLCGTIDTAGALTKKVEWAVNYIDNEIEDKLAAAEADIAEQSQKLDAKIAEVQAQVDKITPPPVGSIKFSASEDVGPGWLPCNGDFISESQYPDLVAALGKLTPSGDKFKLISDGEIGPQISNGVVYGGRMWVYSYSTKKLYGVDLEGTNPIKEITLTSESAYFSDFSAPINLRPICLSIVSDPLLDTPKLFLTQIKDKPVTGDDYQWLSAILIFQVDFSGNETTLTLSPPFQALEIPSDYHDGSSYCVPYVTAEIKNGELLYHCVVSYMTFSTRTDIVYAVLVWGPNSDANIISSVSGADRKYNNQRVSYNQKNRDELVSLHTRSDLYSIESTPGGTFNSTFNGNLPKDESNIADSPLPLNIAGLDYIVLGFSLNYLPIFSYTKNIAKILPLDITLPSAARIFVDAATYLWGKDIYMIFVGTGIIFSRTLEAGSFGYLDTTSVLGTITQFGYLDYSQDEGTLYLLGQDTSNRVKVAKIVLNTLYDYANDGAWLPVIAADGVPAYIKAKPDEGGSGVITDLVDLTVTVQKVSDAFNESVSILFNQDVLIAGTYIRTVSASGNFTVGLRLKSTAWRGEFSLKLNGTSVVIINTSSNNEVGYEKTATFKVSDFISTGVTLGAGS